uniref:Putative ovule protein n=1 Tax=Solanum chacoense TaxID=4108 RepID=A0A0V0IAN1_SOLCH
MITRVFPLYRIICIHICPSSFISSSTFSVTMPFADEKSISTSVPSFFVYSPIVSSVNEKSISTSVICGFLVSTCVPSSFISSPTISTMVLSASSPIFSAKVFSDISFISFPLNQCYENSPSAKKRPESGWRESLHRNLYVHFKQLGHYLPSLRMRNSYLSLPLADSFYPSLLLVDSLDPSPPSPLSSLPLLYQPLVFSPMRNCYPFLRSKSGQKSSVSDSPTLKNLKNLKLE